MFRPVATAVVVLGIGVGLVGEATWPRPAAASPSPEAAQPDVATLLFGTPQWGHAPAGSTITYAFKKSAPDASFGASFEDHITLELGAGDDDASRTAAVKMYSGPNAIPAGPFKSDQQNPVLLLVFEQSLQDLSKSFGANPRYLKNAIRKAWRDAAKIEPAQIEIGGKTVAGTRVTIQPFLHDAQAGRMKGLDSMIYSVEVADSVPGNIAVIDIHAPADGSSAFRETLRFAASKP